MSRLTKDQNFRINMQGPEVHDLVNVLNERKRRHRKQKGEVVKHADGSHWLRYYVDDPVSGTTRVKVSEQIADRGAKESEVKSAWKKRIAEINSNDPVQQYREDDATLGQFFEFTYLPWLKKEKPYSTWRGVERYWKLYMGPIAKKSLRRFKTIDATEFLTALACKPLKNVHGKPTGVIGLGESTHHRCRSILSAVFKLAVNTRGTGWEERTNPISECMSMREPRKKEEREPYTAEEIMAILAAIKRTDGALMFALCATMGLRPSEAAALRWNDFGTTHLSIKRSAAYGKLRDETKTEKSRGDVLIIEPVKTLLAKLRAERKKDEADEFIFQKPGGLPVNHNDFARRHITDDAKGAVPRYCGLYNGRHSTGSELKRLTGGNSLATADVLRNSIPTAEKNYQHTVTADGDAGLVLWEQQLAKVAEDRIAKR
jgi:integrase